MLEENLPDVPHLQGQDRVALAHTAIEELEAEVLILDDGFQHRRLRRDLDIVLVDAAALWGIDYLFPRGLLREPVKALGRADIVMLTRCDLVGEKTLEPLRGSVARWAPGKPVVETAHRAVGLVNASRARLPLDALGQTCAGFCGIGNPEGFRQTLTRLGASVSAGAVIPTIMRMYATTLRL